MTKLTVEDQHFKRVLLFLGTIHGASLASQHIFKCELLIDIKRFARFIFEELLLEGRSQRVPCLCEFYCLFKLESFPLGFFRTNISVIVCSSNGFLNVKLAYFGVTFFLYRSKVGTLCDSIT